MDGLQLEAQLEVESLKRFAPFMGGYVVQLTTTTKVMCGRAFRALVKDIKEEQELKVSVQKLLEYRQLGLRKLKGIIDILTFI